VHKELMFFVIKMTALRWNFPHACIKLKAVGKAGGGVSEKWAGKASTRGCRVSVEHFTAFTINIGVLLQQEQKTGALRSCSGSLKPFAI